MIWPCHLKLKTMVPSMMIMWMRMSPHSIDPVLPHVYTRPSVSILSMEERKDESEGDDVYSEGGYSCSNTTAELWKLTMLIRYWFSWVQTLTPPSKLVLIQDSVKGMYAFLVSMIHITQNNLHYCTDQPIIFAQCVHICLYRP